MAEKIDWTGEEDNRPSSDRKAAYPTDDGRSAKKTTGWTGQPDNRPSAPSGGNRGDRGGDYNPYSPKNR